MKINITQLATILKMEMRKAKLIFKCDEKGLYAIAQVEEYIFNKVRKCQKEIRQNKILRGIL